MAAWTTQRDGLIEVIKDVIKTHARIEEAMVEFETLVAEHYRQPSGSRLSVLVPSIGKFFTMLPISAALEEYDAKYAVKARKHIPLSFRELRHILNTAQNMASSPHLRLITFDADNTLYQDGADLEDDSPLIPLLLRLMRAGVNVAVVTAAGYPKGSDRYAQRFKGLIKALTSPTPPANSLPTTPPPSLSSPPSIFASSSHHTHPLAAFHHVSSSYQKPQNFSACNSFASSPVLAPSARPLSADSLFADQDDRSELCKRFFIVGGECNYWHRIDFETRKLVEVDPEEWMTAEMRGWNEADMAKILDDAETMLKRRCVELRLSDRVKFIRKPRAVGIFPAPGFKIRAEALDELAVSVQLGVRSEAGIPFCSFNSGTDVWVDIGNKGVGLQCLQQQLDLQEIHCLHVGDQLTSVGNDFLARISTPTLWIQNPKETKFFISHLCELMEGVAPLRSAALNLGGMDLQIN